MAVTTETTGKVLKMSQIVDAGDGKTKTQYRSYSKLVSSAGADAVYSLAQAIDGLTVPTMDSAYTVTTEKLINK